jgi:outer membrane autotransporter protein
MAQPVSLDDTKMVPELRAAWTHNFLDTQNQFTAGFLGTGAPSFDQVGPTIGRDAADLGVGLSFAIAQKLLPGNMSGYLQYDATLAKHETANAVAGGVRYRW